MSMAHPSTTLPPEKSPWLLKLLSAKFFGACGDHPEARKNESNIFCMDCYLSLCQHCLHGHSGHRLIQVRRYVYHDVVRLNDINKMVDCSGVQPYIINSARVVFLNERPQPRPTKAHNGCKTCERSLQDEFQFCSMGCKVAAARRKANRSTTSQSMESEHLPTGHNAQLPKTPSAQSMSDKGSESPPESSFLQSENESSSDDEMGWMGQKRYRSERAFTGSPKSVLPDVSPKSIKPPSLPAFIAQSPTKRRKALPQRSPAF